MSLPPLRIRSFAKINTALAVLGRRLDGYHAIQTVFQSVTLCDELEIRDSNQLELICENLPEVKPEDNLVWKAAELLAEACGNKKGASIRLKKQIPTGAGLGGGSADAGALLLGLRRFWKLAVSDSELASIAGKLGSDVPFFIFGGAALGSGRGEIIEPLPDFPSRFLTIIFPGVHVSTAEAYRSLNLGLTSSIEDHRIQRFLGQEKADFLAWIFNDFEATILAAYPQILEAKNFLSERKATATLLSGSGSSVFGFFSDEESSLAAARDVSRCDWQAFPAKTLSRAEYFTNMFG